jgi:hypothetical protein
MKFVSFLEMIRTVSFLGNVYSDLWAKKSYKQFYNTLNPKNKDFFRTTHKYDSYQFKSNILMFLV